MQTTNRQGLRKNSSSAFLSSSSFFGGVSQFTRNPLEILEMFSDTDNWSGSLSRLLLIISPGMFN